MLLKGDLSLIVPLRPGDPAWADLSACFAVLPEGTEIVVCGPEAPELSTPSQVRVIWCPSSLGRGRQLNAGAAAASGRFLWFLHADSVLNEGVVAALTHSVARHPEALHYFDLGFANDGPRLMLINTWGAWFRSHVLGMPFGDQGFCMSRRAFAQAGGYREDVSYGEDHLLVWQAQRAGIPLRCTGSKLLTSARKYEERGWGKTTWWTLQATFKQAWPEWRRK